MTSAVATPARREPIYSCGPVRLELKFENPVLQEALHSLLAQYDAPWTEPTITIHASVTDEEKPVDASITSGDYMTSYRLKVDRQNGSLISRGELGSLMEINLDTTDARITVPSHPDWSTLVEEVEQQFVLLLARGWAEAGWTPLHAGTLIPPDGSRCIFLCAPSGVGKTTLTAAMLRRGWRTLGDDKTLLRKEGDEMIARSLARRFHLHPLSSRWFPEAGDIARWPTYSRWTDKRVVRIEKLWPGRLEDRAIPGAIVRLERDEKGPPVAIHPLNRVQTMGTLLQQIVVPNDSEHARPLVSCIASTAERLRGALVRIGNDAFSDPATVERLEIEFKNLLT